MTEETKNKLDNLIEKIKDLSISDLYIQNSQYGINNEGEAATTTTQGIQAAINWAAEKGITNVYLSEGTYLINCTNTLTLDDATFNYGIKIPSNITLHLGANTTLKAESNNLTNYSVILFVDAICSGLSGGKIQGDRDSHTYITGQTSESCHGTFITRSKHILINSVIYEQCTGDCICIGGKYADGDINYFRPMHIKIKNCILDGARRNNLSIIDGEQIEVTNNIIQNGGTINGTLPKSGIDVEPNYNINNVSYQRAENLFIKRNIFINNKLNGLILHGGRVNKAVIEDNIFKAESGNASLLLHCNLDIRVCNNMFFSTAENIIGIQVDNLPTTYSDTKQRIVIINNQLTNMGMYINADEILIDGNKIFNANLDTQCIRNAIISNNYLNGGRMRVLEVVKDGAIWNENITFSENYICNYNPAENLAAFKIVSVNGTGQRGYILKNNSIVNCKGGIQAGNNVSGGDITIDSNKIYSTLEPTDENYICTSFAIDIEGYENVICTNNIINKTNKCIRYYANSKTKNLYILNNIINAGNTTQAIYLQGVKPGEDNVFTPFSAIFSNNIIKSLSSINTFMVILYLTNCRISNNEIDSQTTYRPINSSNSTGTKYINNITSGTFEKADTDTETGTITI